MRVQIFADGACEPRNPGGFAVAAFVARDPETGIIIAKHAEIITSGDGATNNVAEVSAIAKALAWVETRPEIKLVEILSDSQFAVNVVNRVWRSDFSRRYYPPLVEAWSVLERLRSKGVEVAIKWVSREFNKEADRLAFSLAMNAARRMSEVMANEANHA